jgi:formylglycine-generating enzyme required for sulfatase activity
MFVAATLSLATIVAPALAQSACDADVDGNGTVGATDLASLLSAWGPCTSCAADINDSGAVDAADIAALLSLWGSACSTLPWGTVLEQSPNPKVVTDPALRAAIVATGLPWRVRDNLTQIEMMLIPPGTFDMGCSPSVVYGCNSGGNEDPVHAVTLTNAFYLGRYEVTQAQWTARTGSNPSSYQFASTQVPAAQVPNRPVEQVSWNTVQGFLAGTGLRLPTEAEWEYAYRAGTTTAFHGWPATPSGTNADSLVGTIAWFSANALGQTRPVGGKPANGFGLHDMAGNVWEWVNDWFGSTYYQSSPSVNPPGPASGSGRTYRGGSFDYDTRALRASNRLGVPPTVGVYDLGFRVARTP